MRPQQQMRERGGGGRWKRDDIGIVPGVKERGPRGDRLLADNIERGGGRWRDRNIDLSSVDMAPFRERASEFRQQARLEGRTFNERDFRLNAYEYTQREAWRDDVLRSVISINVGYPNDYYYIPPPAYPTFYGVNYDPWSYNIGYTYYNPEFRNFYVAPYSYAYMPYDPFYSSLYYNDPYYFDDPSDDFLTVRVFASTSGSGFLTRLVGGLLAYGYDQGYRDGLLAASGGYGYTSYQDPFVYYEEPYYGDPYVEETYATYSFYEPYSYSGYENRRTLSEGYELGYRDALYGQAGYDPYAYAGQIDLVSIYVGTTFQIA